MEKVYNLVWKMLDNIKEIKCLSLVFLAAHDEVLTRRLLGGLK